MNKHKHNQQQPTIFSANVGIHSWMPKLAEQIVGGRWLCL
jgi:hypothetical protein